MQHPEFDLTFCLEKKGSIDFSHFKNSKFEFQTINDSKYITLKESILTQMRRQKSANAQVYVFTMLLMISI